MLLQRIPPLFVLSIVNPFARPPNPEARSMCILSMLLRRHRRLNSLLKWDQSATLSLSMADLQSVAGLKLQLRRKKLLYTRYPTILELRDRIINITMAMGRNMAEDRNIPNNIRRLFIRLRNIWLLRATARIRV